MNAKPPTLRIPTVLAWTALQGVGFCAAGCVDHGSARGSGAICTGDASTDAGPDAADVGQDACGIPSVPEEPA